MRGKSGTQSYSMMCREKYRNVMKGKIMKQKERILLWGACDRARRLLGEIDTEQYTVLAVIDNKKEIQGGFFEGIPIYSETCLEQIEFDKIVMCLGPSGVRAVKEQLRQKNGDTTKLEELTYFDKRALIEFYQESEDAEVQKIVQYLRNHNLRVFNYDFTRAYEKAKVDCEFDEEIGMWYVIEFGRRMYFKRSIDTREKVVDYYLGICMEQDIQSPHRYLVDGYMVTEGMVVIDAGVAEGNFSLAIIDKVKKIYMVECDKEWIEALRYTFRNDMEKIVFVNKFLTEKSSDTSITIDEILEGEHIDYIKLDIEGAEPAALRGAEKTLEQDVIINACAYHYITEEEEIRQILNSNGFQCETSRGYMCFLFGDKSKESRQRLVRGMVRAKKI